jgi:hypothetical protein
LRERAKQQIKVKHETQDRREESDQPSKAIDISSYSPDIEIVQSSSESLDEQEDEAVRHSGS